MSGRILGTALFIVSVTEGLGLFLQNYFTPIPIVSAIRLAQILFLFILLFITLGKKQFSKFLTANLYSGLKTGLLCSFIFGIAACLAGYAIFMTGIDPLELIRPSIPKNNLFLFLITAIIIGPITEEIFFRGILYNYLRPSGMLIALLITSAAFALPHYSGDSLPYIQIIGGLIFALSFEYSKNLITPVIIHILGNLGIYFIAFAT